MSKSNEVFDRVVATPGQTALEYEQGEARDVVRKALFGLARSGKVFRGEPRRCRVSRHLSQTWYPVQHTHSEQG